MPVEVKKDRVNETLASLHPFDQSEVLVGFPGSTSGRDEGGINNPTLAYIHEYGAPEANIPPRPFLHPGISDALDDIVDVFDAGVRSALDGKQGAAPQTFNLAGLLGQGAVQKKMVAGPFTPLKAATIRRKGSSKPLIDTGQLRQSVSYVVRKKGATEG